MYTVFSLNPELLDATFYPDSREMHPPNTLQHPPNSIMYIFLGHSYGHKFHINHILVYHHTNCYVLKYPTVYNLTYPILHGGLSHCSCGLYLIAGPPCHALILSQSFV